MARYEQGYLGDFSGKLGKAVGSKWRGVAYIRTKSSNRSNAKTPKQLEQQAKFKIGRAFARAMHNVFSLGFKDQAVKMTGANYGLSYVMNNAITGANPNFTIDYSKVLVSQGTLPNEADLKLAVSSSNGAIQFTWDFNPDDKELNPTDQAVLVAYCPEKNKAAFVINATRSDKLATLRASHFTGKEVHTWLSFIAANGSKLCDSAYVGKLTVT